MINKLPLLGWIISAIANISASVPFWFVWTKCGLGTKYFGFLPDVYASPGFWNTVGIFIILSILKSFSPFAVTQHNNNSNGE